MRASFPSTRNSALPEQRSRGLCRRSFARGIIPGVIRDIVRGRRGFAAAPRHCIGGRAF